MVPTIQPVYLRFEDIDPPRRFLAIVDAYIEFLRESDSTWSELRLMATLNPPLSKSYLNNLRGRIRDHDGKPMPSAITRIVGGLNSILPANQRWDLQHAYIAGDQADKYEENVRPPLPNAHGIALLENRYDDGLPHTVSKVNTPLISIEDIQAKGLRGAVALQRVVQLANNMAFIEGRVPGYSEQQTGEWVLIQESASRNTESKWVLVREGQDIKAMQRHEVKSPQRIIAWILGVMRITA